MKDDDDEDDEEKEDLDEEEEETETEESETESESESSEEESESESEEEDAPIEDKKENINARIKHHENSLNVVKKGNYMLKANVDRLQDDLNKQKEMVVSLQEDLDSVLSELG